MCNDYGLLETAPETVPDTVPDTVRLNENQMRYNCTKGTDQNKSVNFPRVNFVIPLAVEVIAI